MDKKTFFIKYHNKKMLMTLDLNMLVNVMIDSFGENFILEFSLMSAEEQNKTSITKDGLRKVTERFWIFENSVRRKDLEEKIVYEGRK